MTTKEDHRAIRHEWRRDRIRDTFREAQMDEERLKTLEKENNSGKPHK